MGDSNKSIGVCIDKYIVGAGSRIAAISYHRVIEQGGGAEDGIVALTCQSIISTKLHVAAYIEFT